VAGRATGGNELRAFLNDGAQDRPVKNKQLIGVVDGVNTSFLTFDDRVVPGSLVVTVDLAQVPATLNDPVMGIIIVTTTPPAQQTTVRGHVLLSVFPRRGIGTSRCATRAERFRV